MEILGVGPLELILILVVALMVFGPDRLPELGARFGRSFRDMRRATREFSREIEDLRQTFEEPLEEVKEPLVEVRDTMGELAPAFREAARVPEGSDAPAGVVPYSAAATTENNTISDTETLAPLGNLEDSGTVSVPETIASGNADLFGETIETGAGVSGETTAADAELSAETTMADAGLTTDSAEESVPALESGSERFSEAPTEQSTAAEPMVLTSAPVVAGAAASRPTHAEYQVVVPDTEGSATPILVYGSDERRVRAQTPVAEAEAEQIAVNESAPAADSTIADADGLQPEPAQQPEPAAEQAEPLSGMLDDADALQPAPEPMQQPEPAAEPAEQSNGMLDDADALQPAPEPVQQPGLATEPAQQTSGMLDDADALQPAPEPVQQPELVAEQAEPLHAGDAMSGQPVPGGGPGGADMPQVPDLAAEWTPTAEPPTQDEPAVDEE